jgi:hypothetical protein
MIDGMVATTLPTLFVIPAASCRGTGGVEA